MVDHKLVKELFKKTVEDGNWDHYRGVYKRGIDFDSLVELNNLWYPVIQDQEFYDIGKAKQFFDMLPDRPLTVVELGCYRGTLAKQILEINDNIEVWYGYDLCHLALKNRVVEDGRFHPVYMDTQWYNQDHDPFDVFISTHTLEHMTNPEVRQTIVKIYESCELAVYLELPVLESGKTWRGGASSHVLRWGRRYFRDKFTNDGWKIIFEPPAKNTVSAGWAMGATRR